MKVVIISGGHTEDDFALEWLQENKYELLIAADSGMEFLFRNQLVPDVIAGDFDSVGQEAYEHFVGEGMEDASCEGTWKKDIKPEILRLNPIKDDTDTEFVIREAIRRGATGPYFRRIRRTYRPASGRCCRPGTGPASAAGRPA